MATKRRKLAAALHRTATYKRGTGKIVWSIFKLMEYENTGLTPEEAQGLAEKEKPMPVRKTIPVTPGEEWECPNCGNDLSIMDAYAGRCKYCGQKIEEARRTRNGR